METLIPIPNDLCKALSVDMLSAAIHSYNVPMPSTTMLLLTSNLHTLDLHRPRPTDRAICPALCQVNYYRHIDPYPPIHSHYMNVADLTTGIRFVLFLLWLTVCVAFTVWFGRNETGYIVVGRVGASTRNKQKSLLLFFSLCVAYNHLNCIFFCRSASITITQR